MMQKDMNMMANCENECVIRAKLVGSFRTVYFHKMVNRQKLSISDCQAAEIEKANLEQAT